MKICGLEINNFKSIRHLKIENIDNAFILVGKNSTGKTAVLDAIRLAAGMYEVRPENFSEDGKNIEIKMSIQIDDDDMVLLHERGIVSKYRNFDSWLRDFKNKLPSFNNGILDFTFIMNREKGGRYCDGIKKNNKYIKQVIPKIYFVDNERNISEYQHAILMKQADADLYKLLDDKCMFDNSKNCTRCFECIGMINDKPANELTAIQTAKVLEYKLFNQNIDRFAEQVNKYVAKNGLPAQYVKYVADCDFDKYFKLKTYLCNKDRGTYTDVETMSAGTKSIYLLSLLEAYIDDQGGIPCIIMIEDPESYLHPSLQKAASEVLFRLSKKNQVIFSTHSPNMIFNFAGRQINQVVLDEECYTVINEETDIDEILDDLGYTANDLMNVSFVFIVEGKQDSQRLPLLLEKYYSEIYDENGMLKRISIITTNSCTNIKTYANLKYINKLYIKDQFLMIRDSDGKNPKYLVKQLCGYYAQRNNEDVDKLPRVTPKNVLVLSYYSFENYFLDPVIMAKIGVVKSEEEFYNILWQKYRDYLYKLPSMKRMCRSKNVRINNKNDLKKNMENIKTYVRGHNLYDIFYGRYRNDSEREILKRYIDVAPREAFADILDAIDGFVYFENRKKSEDDIRYEMKGK
ncbi:MAG: AAA family ATPase [Lachnospiraceae bacterium]|nr:AAA family ATPase [Lachnospiraceae bacterium]